MIVPMSREQIQLTAQGADDRPDEQGAEQALRHGPEGVNAVTFAGKDNVFPLQKCLKAIHDTSPLKKCAGV